MSSYNLKAKNKQTGEIVDFHAMDNYYGHHRYGYEENNNTFKSNPIKNRVLKESEFDELYEPIEDTDKPISSSDENGQHPYGGMEVLDNVPVETWMDRFNAEFVDEDTGLLNISKYDHERLLDFINREIK